MFYCDPCAELYEWPETIFKSEGACEICEKQAVCNELASRLLPMPTTEREVALARRLTARIREHQAEAERLALIRARVIMALHRRGGLTLREVGRRLDISSARIGQVVKLLDPEARKKKASSQAENRRSRGRPSPG